MRDLDGVDPRVACVQLVYWPPLLRSLHGSSGGDGVEQPGWQTQPNSAVLSLNRPFQGWPDFVAFNLVFDAALTTMLEAAVDSSYEPLRQRARKILQEEQTHQVHAEGWTRRLSSELPSTTSFQQSLASVWDEAASWLGPRGNPLMGELCSGAVLKEGPDEWRNRLWARIGPVLDECRIAPALQARDLPWSRWDPSERRLRRTA